jgi:DNA-binding MarR family transcriptional regulator
MFFLKDLPTREILESYNRRFPEMDVDAVERALSMLRRASVLMRELEAYFSSHGLSQTRFLIMILLDREPGNNGLNSREIALKLDVSKPVVSKTVGGLEGEGHIASTHDPQDARARRLTLTAQGRKELHALLPGYYELIQRHMREEK